MDFQRSDAMLMEILQERKSISGFLDAMFGFLRRNTDFYHTKKDEADKLGFPKGIRDQILYGAMQRYDPDYWLQTMSAEGALDESGKAAPPAIEEVTVASEEQNSEHKPAISYASYKTNKLTFEPNDYKNGAAFAHHCWSQSLKDIELHVQLPAGLQSAKQLCIHIEVQRIRINAKHEPKNVVLEGVLSQRIKHNDAVWSIENGNLLICCDKAKELWWERLFEGDAEIDIKKLDTERYIDELPQDSQVAIERLRVQQMAAEQQQKELQTDPEQIKTLERLRKAWDAEGSPFKGQPFDPSIVQMN